MFFMFLVGCFFGIGIMAIASVRSYEKGREDGKSEMREYYRYECLERVE